MAEPVGIKYWIHYIVYIGPEAEAYEAAIGTIRKTPLEEDFANVEAAQVDVANILRAKSKIPPQIPVTVTILGWHRMESSLIARVH